MSVTKIRITGQKLPYAATFLVTIVVNDERFVSIGLIDSVVADKEEALAQAEQMLTQLM